MSDTPQKIGVSFAIEGVTADDAVQLNAAIVHQFGSEIRLGADGNSQPHVTIALGEAGPDAVAQVIRLVGESVRAIEPFRLRFGPAARETVTGRYVLADVVMPEHARRWRDDLRTRIADQLTELSRTTDEPHLTVAVVEHHQEVVDQLLTARAAEPIADCYVTHVDVAQAGPRGAKGSIIHRFELGDG